ncbi:MAG: hypothetical protein WCL11_16540 [Verrucomicrobiota bacterium]
MKNMIRTMVLSVALIQASVGWAGIYNFTGSGGSYTASSDGAQTIPDYPGSGIAFGLSFDFAGMGRITDISVNFTTISGWNGDLYAYISHGDGLAILLNRVGASTGNADGYGTAGFNNLTLALGGIDDIHTVATPATGGTYAADGRLDYTINDRNNTLSVFNDANPNGAWTLFFADESAGNVASLSSWNVNVTAVPEPANVALAIFGVCAAGVGLGRRLTRVKRQGEHWGVLARQASNRVRQWRTAVTEWVDAV